MTPRKQLTVSQIHQHSIQLLTDLGYCSISNIGNGGNIDNEAALDKMIDSAIMAELKTGELKVISTANLAINIITDPLAADAVVSLTATDNSLQDVDDWLLSYQTAVLKLCLARTIEPTTAVTDGLDLHDPSNYISVDLTEVLSLLVNKSWNSSLGHDWLTSYLLLSSYCAPVYCR